MVIQRNNTWTPNNNVLVQQQAQQQQRIITNHVNNDHQQQQQSSSSIIQQQQMQQGQQINNSSDQIMYQNHHLPPPPIPIPRQHNILPRNLPLMTASLPQATDTQQQALVEWKSTFSMRQVTLSNMASANQGNRHRPHLTHAREKMSVSKSLDILRQNIQAAINKDMDSIIRKYLEKFFQPAIENLRSNLGSNSVTEDHIKSVCRNMFEEAKQMYSSVPQSRTSSPPPDFSDSETGSIGRNFCQSPLFRKRKESDTDSEASQSIKRKRGRGRGGSAGVSGRCTPMRVPRMEPVRREAPKWDPARITKETLFVMGAKANKALGFGLTRGRLYLKHPELFRYSGDQEDKEWLVRHSLMPPTGGKAYLMIVDDISELAETEEYRHNQSLQLHELKGFEAPEFMLHKIRCFMHHMRTDLPGGHRRYRQNSPVIPEYMDNINLSQHVVIQQQIQQNKALLGIEAECLNAGAIMQSNPLMDPRFRDESSGPPTPSDALELLDNTGAQSVSTHYLTGTVVDVSSPHNSLAVMWGSGVQDTSQEPL